VLSLVVAITLTIIIAAVIFQRSGLLSYQLSSHINDHYLKGTPFHFSCGKISGDLVGHVSLARPVLRYREKGNIYEVFRADRITVDYSLLQVLKLKMIVSNLELSDVRIDIREDEEGNPVLPIPARSPGASSAEVLPHVVVERFAIDQTEISYQTGNKTLRVDEIDLAGSMRFVGGEGVLEIDEGRARLEESDLPLRSLEMKARFAKDWVAIEDLKLRTESSLVMVSGRYQDGRLHHLQGIFNPLALREASALGLIDGETGELGGNVVLEGVPDSLAVRGSLTGKALGLVFSGLTLEGVVRPDDVHLSNVEGALFGSRLNGDVTYDRRNGSYTFTGVCEGLDISQGFLNSDDIPETDLNGLISLEYVAPQRRYEFTGDLRRSTIHGFESNQARFRLAYAEPSGLRIRSFNLVREGFELTGSGTIEVGGAAELILALKGDNLDYFMDYVSLPRIGGRADLAGRLVGPVDRFQLNLNGTWEDLSYTLGTIDSSRVYAEAKNVGGDDVTATIDVQGLRLDLAGREFENPHLLISADADGVVVRDFSFAKGDTFITSDFQVQPGDEERSILIKHLVVRTPHSDWVNERPTTLVLRDESATLDTLMLRSIGRQIGAVGDYEMTKRRLDIDVWGRGIDLALIREALELPFRLDGVGEFRTNIRGDVDNPAVDLSLHLTKGEIDSLAFDRLDLTGGFSDRGYHIDQLTVVDAADSLVLSGSWAYMDSPVNVLRRGLKKEIAQDAAISLTARGHRFPLASMLRAAHLPVYWGGGFDGEITVHNRLAAPRLAVRARLLPRPEDRYRLPPVTTDLTYESGVLTIGEISFDDGSTAAKVSGTARLTLGLVEGLVVEDDAPIDVDISLSSKDLSAVAGYFSPIAVSGGKLAGQLRISGPIGNPAYGGSLELSEGTLRLRGTEEVYRNIAATFSLDRDKIRLASLSGTVGKKGRFSGSGSARLARFRLQDYEATVNLGDYTFSSIRDFESTQDGNLHIASQVGVNDKLIPMITGNVNIKQAVITKPIGRDDGPPSTLGLPTEAPSWMCDIDIEAPNNVWLRNPDLNMELGGSLIMKRDQHGLYFRGDLAVLRGSYTLYNNKFRITDGRIDFSTATTLRPDIRLNAYTPHRVAGQEERRIFLDLTWPSDKKEPTIALSYDAPGYSETDLWKMLGGQVVTGDPRLSSGGAVDAATGTAQNIASNYLERILNAQMRDVTVDVESRPLGGVDSATNGQRELTIAVGRYLSEDLYLNYRQGLTVTSAREVDIEYRISNMFLLRSEIIRHQGPKGIAGKSRQTTDEINFDIKFRIEY
jgi:hypothetical protein